MHQTPNPNPAAHPTTKPGRDASGPSRLLCDHCNDEPWTVEMDEYALCQQCAAVYVADVEVDQAMGEEWEGDSLNSLGLRESDFYGGFTK